MSEPWRPRKSRVFGATRSGGFCWRCDKQILIHPQHWVQFDSENRIVHANCANPTNLLIEREE